MPFNFPKKYVLFFFPVKILAPLKDFNNPYSNSITLLSNFFLNTLRYQFFVDQLEDFSNSPWVPTYFIFRGVNIFGQTL